MAVAVAVVVVVLAGGGLALARVPLCGCGVRGCGNAGVQLLQGAVGRGVCRSWPGAAGTAWTPAVVTVRRTPPSCGSSAPVARSPLMARSAHDAKGCWAGGWSAGCGQALHACLSVRTGRLASPRTRRPVRIPAWRGQLSLAADGRRKSSSWPCSIAACVCSTLRALTGTAGPGEGLGRRLRRSAGLAARRAGQDPGPQGVRGVQHAFPDAGGGDEPSRPQGPGLARDRGRADFQRLGELGGGALTGGGPSKSARVRPSSPMRGRSRTTRGRGAVPPPGRPARWRGRIRRPADSPAMRPAARRDRW